MDMRYLPSFFFSFKIIKLVVILIKSQMVQRWVKSMGWAHFWSASPPNSQLPKAAPGSPGPASALGAATQLSGGFCGLCWAAGRLANAPMARGLPLVPERLALRILPLSCPHAHFVSGGWGDAWLDSP